MALIAFVKFLPTDDQKDTIIYARTTENELVQLQVPHSYERCQAALWKYNNGAKIQDAFRFMTPDEREFMMSGISGAAYDGLFPDEEIEPEKRWTC